jgi:ATP-dependent Clp protease protease subunit
MDTDTPAISESAMLQVSEQTVRGGICLATSTLFLDGTVTNEMAGMLARQLHILALIDQPVTIYLNTTGGDRSAMFAIFDLIKAVRQKTTVIGYGSVMSAGVLILQAGTERALTPNCRVMLHPGHAQTGFDLDENVLRQAKELKGETRKMYQLIAQRMGKTISEMEKEFGFDTYISAKQAVKLGLADRVVSG